MPARSVLIGGPLDGGSVLDRPNCGFVWVARDSAGRLRQHGSPGRNRLLYRSARGGYLFAGHTHKLCGNCGGFSALSDRCRLCDGAFVA